jgi:serine O-acetyltransferase
MNKTVMGALTESEKVQKRVSDSLITSVNSNKFITWHNKAIPSVKAISEIVTNIRNIILPGYFGDIIPNSNSLKHFICCTIDRLEHQLTDQIMKSICFSDEAECGRSPDKAQSLALSFIGRLPEIKRLIGTDVKATFDIDPAARYYGEVIYCYPVIRALLNHRIAHELFKLGIPVLPRIISELAHSETGIDIHPGAQIGEYFSIDHGTGVVIGETCMIGDHVLLYQGVTLGAKRFILDDNGIPLNVPRHPIIEDHVVIYANASVLGRITIGRNSVIGGNVWVTTDLPPNSRVVQQKAVEKLFDHGSGI